MKTTTTHDAPTTAAPLAAQLRARGFLPGAPLHISPEVQAIDHRAARAMRCTCGRRGMQLQTYHRGREYAALACCAVCSFGEPI